MSHLRYLLRFMSPVMILTSVSMLPAFFISLYHGETDGAQAFALSIALLAVTGGLLLLLKPNSKKNMYAKEGFLVVGLAWILLSVIGGLPFFFSRSIPSFVDCLFESISGFTTTGASILTNVEGLPFGMLYWRSFTHWIGGMGVLVFLLAFSAPGGSRSVYLMRAESPGPSKGKLMPKLKDTAKILYAIYFALTFLQVLLLLAGGMPLFDSVCTAFGTAGTGGFGVKNTSIGYYDSAYIDGVVTVFMLLFGVNFSVYFLLLLRRFSECVTHEEVRAYFLIVAVAIAVIVIDLVATIPDTTIAHAFRLSSFQVASIITTTGFATTDFNLWPTLSQIVLVALMFIGACGGSTGGGIKVARTLIMFKSARGATKRMVHPGATQIVRMDGKLLDAETVDRVHVFFFIYCLILTASILLVSIDNVDFVTSVTSVVACLNNVGPGLGLVGPVGNYAALSDISKILLSLDMLIGRLEIFPILMVLSPSVWRNR